MKMVSNTCPSVHPFWMTQALLTSQVHTANSQDESVTCCSALIQRTCSLQHKFFGHFAKKNCFFLSSSDAFVLAPHAAPLFKPAPLLHELLGFGRTCTPRTSRSEYLLRSNRLEGQKLVHTGKIRFFRWPELGVLMAVLVQDGCYGLGCQPATQGYQCPALTGRLLASSCMCSSVQAGSVLAFSLIFTMHYFDWHDLSRLCMQQNDNTQNTQ